MIQKKLKINKILLKNRLVVSPMCQYSAINGSPSEWHYQHLGKLSLSGAGMLMLESTSVNKIGKISHSDLCLYNKTHETKLKKLIKFISNLSNIPTGIQLSHSGRKGSSYIPWIKKNTPLKKKDGSWQTCAPSSIKKDKGWPVPKALKKKEINKIISDFKNSAIKAKKIGFDCLEIHMAHGYLLHQFISPISNKRLDDYGGNLKNRCKFPFQVATKIRKIWPKDKILGARITGIDHLKDGININDSIYLVKKLKKIGFDYVCVSSGGIISKTNLKFKNSFRANFAKKIKLNCKNIKVRTTGNIQNISQINQVLTRNKIDFVAVGRKFLIDPLWFIKEKKNIVSKIPKQYERGI